MNKMILLGRLTDSPEIKYSAQGTAYTRFSIAVNRDRGNTADFFNCTAFDKTAEAIANYCDKGRQVLLEGRVEVQTQDTENGRKTYFQVIVNQIEFLAKPGRQEQQPPINNNPNNANVRQNQSYNNNPNTNYNRYGQGQYEQQQFQPSINGWNNPN